MKVVLPATLIEVSRCITKLHQVSADVVFLSNIPQPFFFSKTFTRIYDNFPITPNRAAK
jgi:hypothetical protein